MKNSTFFKYAVIFCIVNFLTSCSNDNDGLELIEDINQSELNLKGETNNSQEPQLELVVIYTFSPFSTEEEQDDFKANFKADMSQYFTIYETVSGRKVCGTIEKWTVNEGEYDDYLFNFPNTPPGGTSNSSTGLATITIVKRPGSGGGIIIDDQYEYCFAPIFPF